MRAFRGRAIPLLLMILAAETSGQTPAARSEDPWAGAEARIESVRKGDGVVTLLGADGKPMAGVRLRLEQTRHAFLFGCNIFNWGEESSRYRKGMKPGLQRDYRDRFRELFNFATLPFYYHYEQPRLDTSRKAYLRRLATWCRENGITPKGHPLLYNFVDPPWATDDLDDLARRQLGRVNECVREFAGLIDTWDVVNEASFITLPDRWKGAPKLTAMWERAGCLTFAQTCFRVARATNPKAALLINDYILDQRYEQVVKAITDDQGKRLYDVIGLQSHMHDSVWSNEKAWEICERYAKFGAPIHITETTIISGGRQPAQGPWPTSAEGEARQAREVERIYTIFFSHPAVEAITWWDLADGYAWKGAPAGLLHADMTPKPAYDALMKLIKGKWWTNVEVTTDADGKAAFRGFYGDYHLALADGRPIAVGASACLKKDETNCWTAVLDQ